jgi:hypothetical protein
MPNLAIYRGVPKRATGISALSIKEQGYKVIVMKPDVRRTGGHG